MNIRILLGLFILNLILFFFFLITQHFPIFAVLIQVGSIFVVLGWIIRPKYESLFQKKHLVDFLLVCSLFVLALSVYLYKVEVITPGIQGDELAIAKAGEGILSQPEFVPFVDVNYGHPTPLLYFEGISIKLLGRTLTAIRLPSIVFGALSIAGFYLLLRLFFRKIASGIVSLFMLFSYPFVIVSRVAYEITPSIFFQILSAIFLYSAWKTKDIRYYAALGITIGAGLYTYVGFRTFALLILGLSIYLTWKTLKDMKKIRVRLLILFLTFFIVITPLLSFSIGHTQEIMARTQALSLFGQGLPTGEVLKELAGSSSRLSRIFFLTDDPNTQPNGDPNFKNNPSNVNMFDFGTLVLLLLGSTLLFFKNKKLFVIVLILSISAIGNDIFSLERVPEGHYYGLGHPNTLRIAGIIPIIYFLIAFGIDRIKPTFEKIYEGVYPVFVILVSLVIIAINWYLYFSQPSNQFFSVYNYVENDVKALRVANAINKSIAKTVYLSPTLLTDERVKYFIRQDLVVKPYDPETVDQIVASSTSPDITVVDTAFHEKLAKAFLQRLQAQPDLFHGQVIVGPDNKVDAFVLTSENF